MPPQLVACEGLHFYRITEDSLHVFEASTRVPPPQLRGSATASHSARIEVGNPRNVIALGKNRVLVAGEKNTFRYQTGAKEAEPGTPLASGAPSFLWRDRKSDASFWVRALGEKKLHRYTWPSGAEPPAITAKLGHSVEPLSEFDARLFVVLSNGVPLYSTKEGLSEPSKVGSVGPLPSRSKPGTIVFADAAHDRYWTADASGALTLSKVVQPKPPLLSARVPGVVIDAAVEGDRVAVLTMELEAQVYRPTVTVFAKHGPEGQLSIGPSMAHLGQPALDLCLIEGRPWVVVGGRQWLQLLDWAGPRLLAEW
jgi:hypothetical protein